MPSLFDRKGVANAASSRLPTFVTRVSSCPDAPQDTVMHTFRAAGTFRQGVSDAMDAKEDNVVMCVELSSMKTLGEHENMTCSIAMDDFDKAKVDFLPEDACFVEHRPELCVATLPCGHRFHALSLLCNMVISGMRCPVCRCVHIAMNSLFLSPQTHDPFNICRSGTRSLPAMDSIPLHLKPAILDVVRRSYLREMQDISQSDHVLAQILSREPGHSQSGTSLPGGDAVTENFLSMMFIEQQQQTNLPLIGIGNDSNILSMMFFEQQEMVVNQDMRNRGNMASLVFANAMPEQPGSVVAWHPLGIHRGRSSHAHVQVLSGGGTVLNPSQVHANHADTDMQTDLENADSSLSSDDTVMSGRPSCGHGQAADEVQGIESGSSNPSNPLAVRSLETGIIGPRGELPHAEDSDAEGVEGTLVISYSPTGGVDESFFSLEASASRAGSLPWEGIHVHHSRPGTGPDSLHMLPGSLTNLAATERYDTNHLEGLNLGDNASAVYRLQAENVAVHTINWDFLHEKDPYACINMAVHVFSRVESLGRRMHIDTLDYEMEEDPSSARTFKLTDAQVCLLRHVHTVAHKTELT